MKWVPVVKVLEQETSSKAFAESTVGSNGRQQLMQVVYDNCMERLPCRLQAVCVCARARTQRVVRKCQLVPADLI
jgi:hypothetical protein